MRYLSILGIFTGVFISYSCTEKYDLDIKDNTPRLVVEGLITDQPGPYYVRLTKSSSEFTFTLYSDSLYYQDSKGDTVNAFVLITDNTSGFTDTLIHSPDGFWH